MNSQRTLEMTISRDNMVSQIAAFLYAIGIVHGNEEVINIQFTDVNQELVPIKVIIKGG